MPLFWAASPISRVVVILPIAVLVPTVSATFGCTSKHSPDVRPREHGGEPLVETADDLKPGLRRIPQDTYPRLWQPPPSRGEPDEYRVRRVSQGFTKCADYRRVTPEARHNVEDTPPGEGRIDDGGDLGILTAIGYEAMGGLSIAVLKTTIGEEHGTVKVHEVREARDLGRRGDA